VVKMDYNKILLASCGIAFALIAQSVLALNIDFVIAPSKTSFYPNETIPINISVINREATFAAKNLSLTVLIGQKNYTFDLEDLAASKSITKSVVIPEQVSGTYQVHGILKYAGYFGEITTTDTYNSFEVKFPEIARLPRNIYIKSFDIPENVTAGKSYNVSVNVVNNGTITGDLIIKVESLDVNASKELRLEPNQIQDVKLSVLFYNPGISLVEAKVYATVDNVKYLINYANKNVYVTEEKIAKLQFDRIELVDEPDNQINQNDEVKLKIYLRNDGNSAASNVKETLSSSEIAIAKSVIEYELLLPKETGAYDYFVIKTVNASVGQHNLTIDVTFSDLSESHQIDFPISIEVKPDLPQPCKTDSDCTTGEVCNNSKCEKLTCECGEAEYHKCIRYACCSDLDCEEGYLCGVERHTCEPSAILSGDVLIVTSSRLKTTDEFKNVLKDYRNVLSSEGLSSFYIVLDSPKVEALFKTKVQDIGDWKSVKDVMDKVVYKLNSKYILILGGVDIIPMPLAKTDAEIPVRPVSDDMYSDITLDGIPDVALGRIPTPSEDNSDKIVITALRSAISMHGKHQLNKVIIADTCIFPPNCELGLRDVNLISQRFFSKDCYDTNSCKTAPPYCTGSSCKNKEEFYQVLTSNDIIHLDAHGEPYSFAAHNKDGWFTVIVSEDLYKNRFKTNPVFTTAACHSATIDSAEFGRINAKASPFAFLANGAAVYIGNTRYGYGGITAELLDEFYSNAKTSTVGVALLSVKRSNLGSRATSDWTKAVIYEIQLYGDPTIKLVDI